MTEQEQEQESDMQTQNRPSETKITMKEDIPLKTRIKRTFLWMLGDEKKLMWFTILLGGLITFGTTFMLKLHERATLSIIVMLLIWILWLFLLHPEAKEEVLQGWCITWIDKQGAYPFLKRENNLELVFCNYKKYPDGTIETIPYTEHYGVYTKDAVNHIKFNPMVNSEIIKMLEKEYDMPVVWADGTDKYYTPLAVEHRRINKILQSGTPTAVVRTSEWLRGKK